MGGAPVLANGRQGIGNRPGIRGRGGQTFFDVSTGFDVSTKSSPGSDDTWVTQAAELSDATGNTIESSASTSSSGSVASPMTFLGEYRLSLDGTLWPDESAWRLKLWLKRKSGAQPGELVTFRNVPVPIGGATNAAPITTNVGDIKLTLVCFYSHPIYTNTGRIVFGSGRTPPTRVTVEFPSHPAGIAVDLVRLTTDNGEEPKIQVNDWGPGSRTLYLSEISTNARTADITFFVQQMRTVEFLVKPPSH